MISIYFLLYFTCSLFYFMFGVYIISKDKHSNINKTLFLVCLSLFFWSIGYGFMFIATDIYLANFWRLISAIGWCFFFSIWVELAILIGNKENVKPKKNNIKLFLYTLSLSFFMNNIYYDPKIILYRLNNNWCDNYPITFMEILFDIYYYICIISATLIYYKLGKNSNLKRERKQSQIIVLTSSITFILGFMTDTLLPVLNVKVLPLAILAIPIGLIGVWYSISKYKMITVAPTPKYLYKNISEYLFKIVNDPVFIIGHDLLIRNVNDKVSEMLGGNLLGKNFNSFITTPSDLFGDLLRYGSIDNVEVYFIRNNNNLLECELSGKVIYDEFKDIYGIIIILHDISERKKREDKLKKSNCLLENKVFEKIKELEEESFNRVSAENKIQYIGYHDELTALPNRRYFNEFIFKLIKDLEENGNNEEYFIVIFLDLDNFKLINDTYGHHNGDSLLCHYAHSIKTVIRKNDLVARIGGDEFLILITNINTNEKTGIVESLSNKILNIFNEPFIIEDKDNFLTASIGIASYPEDGKDAGTLIMNADIAMYEAKNAGKNNIKICTEEMKNKIISKTILRNSLYKALSRGELSVYYQPQVNINSSKIIGFEALLRWKLNNEDFVSPVEFIPLAEDTGLIVCIGYWVIKTACDTLKKWNSLSLGNQNFSMAINLSINQLNESEFINTVAKIIIDSGINPTQLEFEVTERIILKGNDVGERNLEDLKKLGVKISIDDFGTEYSSFMNIKKLSIDKIKIDMAFIQGLNINKKDNVIVNSIIALSHDLDLSVIAEGVETKEQLDYLRYFNCDAVQGYYYYKPMPDTEIEGILKQEMSMSNLTLISS